jgi:hypothetical protein
VADEDNRPGLPGREAADNGYRLWPVAVEQVRLFFPGTSYEVADAALVGACTAETRPIRIRCKPCHDAQGVDDWKLKADDPRLRNAAFVYLPDLPGAFSPVLPGVPVPSAPSPEPTTKTKRALPLPELKAEMQRRAEGRKMEREWSREAEALSTWAAIQPALSELPHKTESIRRNQALRTVHLELIEKYRV